MDKYLLLNRGVLQPQGMDNLKLVVAQIEKDTENNPLFYEDFFSDPPQMGAAVRQRISECYL